MSLMSIEQEDQENCMNISFDSFDQDDLQDLYNNNSQTIIVQDQIKNLAESQYQFKNNDNTQQSTNDQSQGHSNQSQIQELSQNQTNNYLSGEQIKTNSSQLQENFQLKDQTNCQNQDGSFIGAEVYHDNDLAQQQNQQNQNKKEQQQLNYNWTFAKDCSFYYEIQENEKTYDCMSEENKNEETQQDKIIIPNHFQNHQNQENSQIDYDNLIDDYFCQDSIENCKNELVEQNQEFQSTEEEEKKEEIPEQEGKEQSKSRIFNIDDYKKLYIIHNDKKKEQQIKKSGDKRVRGIVGQYLQQEKKDISLQQTKNLYRYCRIFDNDYAILEENFEENIERFQCDLDSSKFFYKDQKYYKILHYKIKDKIRNYLEKKVKKKYSNKEELFDDLESHINGLSEFYDKNEELKIKFKEYLYKNYQYYYDNN